MSRAPALAGPLLLVAIVIAFASTLGGVRGGLATSAWPLGTAAGAVVAAAFALWRLPADPAEPLRARAYVVPAAVVLYGTAWYVKAPYWLITAALLAVLLWYLSERRWRTVAMLLLVTAGLAYGLFGRVLGTPLP